MNKPERREILLALVLGFLAGPVYLIAGPGRFVTWYALILGAGMFGTSHWLREIRPGRAWAFPLAGLTGAMSVAVSLLLCTALKFYLTGG